MKNRGLLAIIVMFLIVVSSSCVDFNSGKRPNDYDNTKWVSTQPDIWFEVHNRKCTGEATINDKVTKIYVSFDYGNTVEIYPMGKNSLDEVLMIGRCKFSKEKLVVFVSKNEKGLADESVTEITFMKEE